jgi:transcriptional regulator with XRE-family HTH domain
MVHPVTQYERNLGKMRLQSGDTLKALISQRRLNQSRLAAAAGCSASFVNGLCAGTKTSCSDALAARIAEVLEVPTDVLFIPTQSRDAVHNIPQSGDWVAAS